MRLAESGRPAAGAPGDVPGAPLSQDRPRGRSSFGAASGRKPSRRALVAAISYTRILAVPLLVFFSGPSPDLRAVFWICLAAALSDYFDGVTARALGVQSYRGKVLDFTCDKVFLSVALLSLWRAAGADAAIAGSLVAYHLLVLLAMTVISWGVGKPLTTITTGEKLVVIFSYVLVVAMAGRAAFPGKGIYGTLVWIGGILSITSMVFAVVGYLRLIRRFLRRYSQ
ncbi:CDP-alcohol phosphatidyltransferase family protein [Candidatus Fermentibacterales bacterium]|nr:CDP-alcohol phosphatidyltransferase family protein [Candidatus Fermentibacterales bacterium]